MAETLTFSDVLVSEHCYSCGIHFAMPRDYREQRMEDHRNFHCPNGHAQHFVGETDAEKLQKERDRSARLRAEADQLEASNRALRGVVTRKTRQLTRVENGVCPQCKRSFQNLRRHMESQHSHTTKGDQHE